MSGSDPIEPTGMHPVVDAYLISVELRKRYREKHNDHIQHSWMASKEEVEMLRKLAACGQAMVDAVADLPSESRSRYHQKFLSAVDDLAADVSEMMLEGAD